MHRGSLVVALAGVVLAAGTAAARAAEAELSVPFVRVTGTGEVEARPDMAQISVGVVTQAETAREALEANNEAMQQLLGALKESGIDQKDIRTARFDVAPQYRHDRQQRVPPEIVAYQVTNLVEISVRDLSQLGEILDKVVQQGANRVQGIGFSLQDPAALLDEARRQAMADARHKAELFARAAGATLGAPQMIHEESALGPLPTFARRVPLREAARAVPVEPGQQTLTANVTVTYTLRIGQER